jgi:hypothetical protein
VEEPFAGDVLGVLKTDLPCLASVDDDLVEFEIFLRHAQLRNRQVGCEVYRVLWPILDVDWHKEASAAKSRILSRLHYYLKEDRLVWHTLHSFVGLDYNAGLIQQLLVKVEVDCNLAAIGQSERLLYRLAHNDVAEVARVGRDIDVVQVYGGADSAHVCYRCLGEVLVLRAGCRALSCLLLGGISILCRTFDCCVSSITRSLFSILCAVRIWASHHALRVQGIEVLRQGAVSSFLLGLSLSDHLVNDLLAQELPVDLCVDLHDHWVLDDDLLLLYELGRNVWHLLDSFLSFEQGTVLDLMVLESFLS